MTSESLYNDYQEKRQAVAELTKAETLILTLQCADA